MKIILSLLLAIVLTGCAVPSGKPFGSEKNDQFRICKSICQTEACIKECHDLVWPK